MQRGIIAANIRGGVLVRAKNDIALIYFRCNYTRGWDEENYHCYSSIIHCFEVVFRSGFFFLYCNLQLRELIFVVIIFHDFGLFLHRSHSKEKIKKRYVYTGEFRLISRTVRLGARVGP